MTIASTMPRVSILMNSRNAHEYLVDAVRSVLWQTYAGIELIVCEASDGDEGIRLVESFADPRVTIIRDIDRRGWAHGINLAAARATGDLILFCAGDDIFHPRCIERMVMHLLDTRVGTVVVPVRGIDARGVPLGRSIVVPEYIRCEPTWVRLFERNYIVVALSRRDVLPAPLIDESICGVGGDWHLWLQLVVRGTRFGYLDEMLFDYRVHNRSLVATEGNTRNDMRVVLSGIPLDDITAAYQRSGLPRPVFEEGLANIAITLGNYAAALPYWEGRAASGDTGGAAQAGALLLKLGDLDRAEAMLLRAAAAGTMPEAWNNLGVVHARRGRTDRARACFEEGLRQFPLYQDARVNLAGTSPLLVTERLLRPVDQILR